MSVTRINANALTSHSVTSASAHAACCRFPDPRGLLKSLWMSFMGYVNGGAPHAATSWASRIVLFGYCFFMYISVSSYTANLARCVSLTLPCHGMHSRDAVCVRACVCVLACAHMYDCIHVHMNIDMHAYTHVNIHTHACPCMMQ